jgi:hypothetical protein
VALSIPQGRASELWLRSRMSIQQQVKRDVLVDTVVKGGLMLCILLNFGLSGLNWKSRKQSTRACTGMSCRG